LLDRCRPIFEDFKDIMMSPLSVYCHPC